LDGMVDAEGKVLACSPPEPVAGDQSCSFEQSSVSCETHGKPERLTLRYLGNGPVANCLDNAASRADEKPPICEGNVPAGATVDIALESGDATKTTVAPGETFDITGYSSQTELLLTGGGGEEFVSFHTSCSAPLQTGDIFGNLELVGLDGQRSTATVTYEYEVMNSGDALTNVIVSDNLLGTIGTLSLAAGANDTLTATAEIGETTTNVGSATGTLPNGESCAAEPDSVTVEAVKPTCRVTLELKEIKDDEIKFKVRNTGDITATIESVTLDFPAGYEAIKEVKFEGDMFKADDSDNYPDGVPSGTTLGESDWTKAELKGRQVKADDNEELKFKFTEKHKDADISDFGLTVQFAEGCELELEQ
ncbi:MAG: hypothetical protein KJO62_08770, partial [Gammaproteobacteria bacterium]|nr:hypothetical protein [Gammaproteobacteria bacterium]